MGTEYDVWSDAEGRIVATVANRTFVDDGDAPYGFSRHEIRVSATSRREAIALYRAAR